MLVVKNKSIFLLWGTKRYFHVNFSSKISILLTPNMAALSRGCKPRIHGWLKLKYCYQMQYRYSHFLIRCFTEFRKLKVYNKIYVVYREYFMESAGVRYLRTNCWRIRNRTSERSERVKFLIQKQRVRKYRTKHFPCRIVFIIYILRHSSFWRPFYFKSFKNAEICGYTLTAKWQRKRSISFFNSKNVC